MTAYTDIMIAYAKAGLNPNEPHKMRTITNLLVANGLAKTMRDAHTILKRLHHFAWYPATDDDANSTIRHTEPIEAVTNKFDSPVKSGEQEQPMYLRRVPFDGNPEIVTRLINRYRKAPVGTTDTTVILQSPQAVLETLMALVIHLDDKLIEASHRINELENINRNSNVKEEYEEPDYIIDLN